MKWFHNLIHGKPKPKDEALEDRIRVAQEALAKQSQRVDGAAAAQAESADSLERYAAESKSNSVRIQNVVHGVLDDLNRRD